MRVSASFALRLSLSDWLKKLVQSAPTNQNKLIVSGDWSTSLFPPTFHELRGKRGGLMVSGLDSGASGPGARFSKLPVISGPVKLFCFPFQMGVSKLLKIIQ